MFKYIKSISYSASGREAEFNIENVNDLRSLRLELYGTWVQSSTTGTATMQHIFNAINKLTLRDKNGDYIMSECGGIDLRLIHKNFALKEPDYTAPTGTVSATEYPEFIVEIPIGLRLDLQPLKMAVDWGALNDICTYATSLTATLYIYADYQAGANMQLAYTREDALSLASGDNKRDILNVKGVLNKIILINSTASDSNYTSVKIEHAGTAIYDAIRFNAIIGLENGKFISSHASGCFYLEHDAFVPDKSSKITITAGGSLTVRFVYIYTRGVAAAGMAARAEPADFRTARMLRTRLG